MTVPKHKAARNNASYTAFHVESRSIVLRQAYYVINDNSILKQVYLFVKKRLSGMQLPQWKYLYRDLPNQYEPASEPGDPKVGA